RLKMTRLDPDRLDLMLPALLVDQRRRLLRRQSGKTLDRGHVDGKLEAVARLEDHLRPRGLLDRAEHLLKALSLRYGTALHTLEHSMITSVVRMAMILMPVL